MIQSETPNISQMESEAQDSSNPSRVWAIGVFFHSCVTTSHPLPLVHPSFQTTPLITRNCQNLVSFRFKYEKACSPFEDLQSRPRGQLRACGWMDQEDLAKIGNRWGLEQTTEYCAADVPWQSWYAQHNRLSLGTEASFHIPQKTVSQAD